MKLGSTLLLRGVIGFIGLVVLAVCVFVLPRVILAETKGDFDYGPIFVGLYVAAVPFFIALWQAFQLLNYIDKNKAFSRKSVAALRNIKYCAVAISALFALGMPYIFYVADRDDAPGTVAIGFVIIAVSFVVAAFAGLLQGLIQNAVDIKTENDLTV